MDDFEEVLKGKYPAKAHAVKVTAYLKSQDPSADGLIYLEGQKTRMIDDNDEPVPFRSVQFASLPTNPTPAPEPSISS